jgi:hypothetical protein
MRVLVAATVEVRNLARGIGSRIMRDAHRSYEQQQADAMAYVGPVLNER